MADGAWEPTAHILAMLYSVNRDPKKSPPLGPNAFNPFSRTKDEPTTHKITLKQWFELRRGSTPTEQLRPLAPGEKLGGKR